MRSRHMHTRLFWVGSLLVALSATSADAPGKAKTSGLLGLWQCTSGPDSLELIFQSESVLVYDGEPSQYTLVPGAFRVEEDCGSFDYPYTLKGDSLSVIFPEGSQINCKRVKADGGR